MKSKEKIKLVKEYFGGISTKKLADDVGYHAGSLANVEQRENAEMPYKFANALNKKYPQISLKWLLDDEGDMIIPLKNTLKLRQEKLIIDSKIFGRQLNRIIVESGLLNWEAAKLLELSEDDLADLLLGKKQPTLALVFKICSNFDVTADKLLFDRE